MKDSIALIIAAAASGGTEMVQTATQLIEPSGDQTMISSAISIFTGLIAMLLNRFLNKLANKKLGRTT